MKINEWKANNPDAGAVREINEKLGISKLSARLLAARGVDNAASAEKFLKHDLSSLHDPFLLPDMRAAVDRINSAIENKECIVVYQETLDFFR